MNSRRIILLSVVLLLAIGAPRATPCSAETLWIAAGQAKRLCGPLVLGQRTGILEAGALGEFLVSAVYLEGDSLSGGYAEYDVAVPQTAVYHVWARMRSPLGVVESFALVPPGEEPTTAPSRCLGTSKGSREWLWVSGSSDEPSGARRLSVRLAAGRVVLRLYARTAADSVYPPYKWRMGRPTFNARLNLLCLTTDPSYVPCDADATKALHLAKAPVESAAPVVRPAPLPAVCDRDLRRLGKARIPDWLRCPRFYVKDSRRPELASRRAGDIAALVRQIAACEGNAFRLGCYWGGEVYFQSRVAPHAPGLGSIDYLREAVEQGRRCGVKIVMYLNNGTFSENNPLYEKAAVRDVAGRPIASSYGAQPNQHHACINHPEYRRFIEALLVEAFSLYGPDGLYVDGALPPKCFCAACREKYRRMFRLPMPTEKLAGYPAAPGWEMSAYPTPVGDPRDADSQRYTGFLYESMRELMQLMSQTVKRCKPDAAAIFHTWPKPGTIGYYDATLTEVYLKQPWVHNLWKFGELANCSNLFSVPVMFNIYLHDCGVEEEARIKMFQGLANGCFPACWNELAMRETFGFLREHAAYYDFARTVPARFLAFPRDIHVRPPHVGFYSALARHGVPSVALPMHDFHQRLDGFRVVCLADEGPLSDEQCAALRRFVASGGGLVATHATSLEDEMRRPRGDFGLADLFGVRYAGSLRAAPREVRLRRGHPVTEGPDNLSPVAHDESHLAVELAGGASLGELAGADPKEKAAPAVVVHQVGRGRVVYLPGQWDAIECRVLTPAIERLLVNAVGWAAGGREAVQIKAPAPVASTLFDQEGRRILHLINLNGRPQLSDYQIQPIEGIQVRLEVPPGRHVRRLRRLWRPATLPFQAEGLTVSFTLDHIDAYEVVAAEW